MDVYRQKYNGKTWGCFSVSDVENPTVLSKKKTTTSPPIAGKRGGVREKKVREGDRGRRGDTEERQRRERERGKEKSEGGCNKTNLDVCASCRCGHCEYCGRKGTAWGETTLLLLLLPRHLIRRCAAFACIPLSESQAILASW